MTKKERNDLIKQQYPVLYHGKDARILALSTEQRTAFKDSCIEVANYLWPLLKPDVMGMIDVALGSPLFKYDGIYLKYMGQLDLTRFKMV